MSTPKDTVFIYVLQRISDKAYLYIGSSKNPQKRFNDHRLKNKYAIVRSAFLKNDIRFVVIAQTDEDRRLDVEHDLWKQFIEAGHPIVNIDPAFTSYRYGYLAKPLSAEARKKIGDANRGRHHTEEVKRKISASKQGHAVSEKVRWSLREHNKTNSPPMLGKRHNPETRQKMSEIAKLRRRGSPSDDTRQKMSASNKGKRRSDEARKHMSESHANISQETRRKMSESAKLRCARQKAEKEQDDI